MPVADVIEPQIPEIRRGGVTLLELMIAVAIFSIIATPMTYFSFQSSRAFSSLAKTAHLRSRAPVVMDRLIDELLNGQFASLNPPIPANSSWIRFRKIVGFDINGPVFGNPIQIDVVADESDINNGVDDDGDGLIDEGALRIWEDAPPYASNPASAQPGSEDTSTVIATNIAKDGLRFTRQGAFLEIDVTYEVIVERDRQPVRINIKSGVVMRN